MGRGAHIRWESRCPIGSRTPGVDPCGPVGTELALRGAATGEPGAGTESPFFRTFFDVPSTLPAARAAGRGGQAQGSNGPSTSETKHGGTAPVEEESLEVPVGNGQGRGGKGFGEPRVGNDDRVTNRRTARASGSGGFQRRAKLRRAGMRHRERRGGESRRVGKGAEPQDRGQVQHPGGRQEGQAGEVVTKRRGRTASREARKRRGKPGSVTTRRSARARRTAGRRDSGRTDDGGAIFGQPQERPTSRVKRRRKPKRSAVRSDEISRTGKWRRSPTGEAEWE